MDKTVFITGATSGIGKSSAQAFAAQKYRLILTGRRYERLRELKLELEAAYGIEVETLSFDIRDRNQCEAAIESLSESYRKIDILVNNAGLAAGLDHFEGADMNDWEEMIDTNIKGLLYISRKISGIMLRQGAGHIINIGSIAGTQPYEKGHVYCATKHAVHALSQTMRIDFLGRGIKVTEIRPGMVETEFSVVRFRGDKQKADAVYEGVTPLTGEDVARAIVWAAGQPDHVNIDEILLTPTAQANAYYTHREK